MDEMTGCDLGTGFDNFSNRTRGTVMRDDHSQNSIWQKLQHVPFALIVGSLLYKFFEQSAKYHDELINVAKAATADIFGYASRPAFFTINTLSVAFFGNNTLSLSFSSYLAFVTFAWLTYQYLRRYQGYAAAVAGVAALAWAGWTFPIEIRGMPHLYPAVFLMAAIYFYHKQMDQGTRPTLQWIVAGLLWLALLSHPTGIALLVGFFFLVAMDALWLGEGRRIGQLARVAVSWMIPMLCFWIVVEILFYLFADNHHSYVGYWIEGIEKTSSIDYSRYFKPYGFYFHLLFFRLLPMWVLFGVSAAVYLVATLSTRGRKQDGRARSAKFSGGQRAVGLLVAALVSLCVISLEKWKFDRVLATFVPLVSLALVYSIFQMVRSTPRYAQASRLFAMAVVVVSSFATFVHDARGVSTYFAKRYPVYSASFDIIRHLPAKDITYLGEARNIRRAEYQTDAAGKTLTVQALSKKARVDGRSIVEALIASGRRYVILDVRDNDQVARNFHQFAYKAGLTRKTIIYSRNAFELWELAPTYLGAGIEDRLMDLSRGEKIALLVDKKRDLWLQWALDDKRYRSWFLRRTPSIPTLGKFSVIFVSHQYSGRKSVQAVLKGAKFKRVENLSTYMNVEQPIEMWIRQ